MMDVVWPPHAMQQQQLSAPCFLHPPLVSSSFQRPASSSHHQYAMQQQLSHMDQQQQLSAEFHTTRGSFIRGAG